MRLSIKILTAFIAAATVFAIGAASAQVSDPAVINNQGVEFYERGNYAAAAQKFEAALALSPENVDMCINLGFAYQAAENHDAAAKAFKKAIQLDPSNFEAHNSLGVSLYRIGEKERAMEEWKFVLAIDPGNAAAAANLGIARHPERADEILYETKAAMKPSLKGAAQRAIAAYFERGKLAYKKGDFGQATQLFTEVLQEKPDSKFSYYYLGMSLAYLDKPEAAMKNLREYMILENYPAEGAVEYERAMAAFNLLRSGKPIKARISLKEMQAAKAFKDGKDAYLAKDYFKTVHFLKIAASLKPDSYQVNYYLGMAYRGIGDKERATFHLAKCLLAGPEARTKDEALKLAAILKELTK
ncbi:MAG: tetratricopeptide repeat protein [bacterium]